MQNDFKRKHLLQEFKPRRFSLFCVLSSKEDGDVVVGKHIIHTYGPPSFCPCCGVRVDNLLISTCPDEKSIDEIGFSLPQYYQFAEMADKFMREFI